MRFKFLLLMCAFALPFPALNVNGQVNASSNIKPGDKAPDFTYFDMDGNEVRLSDFKGKYVFIDFWFTRCVPCIQEMPHFKALEEKMRGKKIVFLSVCHGDDEPAWKRFIARRELTGNLLHAPQKDDFIMEFDVRWMPRFILIDKKGKVVNTDMTRPSNPATEEALLNLKGI